MSKELEVSLTSSIVLPTHAESSLNLKAILGCSMTFMGAVGLTTPFGIFAMTGSWGWLFLLPVTVVLGLLSGYSLIPPILLIRRVSRMIKKSGVKLTFRDKFSIWRRAFNYWEFEYENKVTGLSFETQHDLRSSYQNIYVNISPKDDLNKTLYNALTVKNGSIGTSFIENNHVPLENTTEEQKKILEHVGKMNQAIAKNSRKGKDGFSMLFSEGAGLRLHFEKDEMFHELKEMCEKDFKERMRKSNSTNA